MKLFISWSGEDSHLVAQSLREWLPQVIQAVRPFISSEDIAKGARWSTELAQQLEQTLFGILCLTPDNVDAAWLLFEAGALSKTLGSSFVCPYLVGLKPSDLKGPLAQFQACIANAEDTKKLVTAINAALQKEALPEAQVQKAFDKWWPDLQKELERVPVPHSEPIPRRSDRDLIEEILTSIRSLHSLLPSISVGESHAKQPAAERQLATMANNIDREISEEGSDAEEDDDWERRQARWEERGPRAGPPPTYRRKH